MLRPIDSRPGPFLGWSGMKTPALPALCCALVMTPLLAQTDTPSRSFTVTLDPVEHGTVTVKPPLPADGRVAAGTVLEVTATPAEGHAFDSGYYAQPGIWGKMFHESMSPSFQVTVDRDKAIGASFVEKSALEGFTVRQDVVYAKPGVKPLKYDVFAPVGARDLPILVIIHGGGWVSNNEDIMRGLARELVRGGGYVVCSLDYRWLGDADGDTRPNTMADLIGDIFGGLVHIQEHAREYGGDGTRIGVTGDSAGGHLSAVASLMTDKIGDGGFGTTAGVWQFRPSYLPAGKTAADLRASLTAAIRAAAPSYGAFGMDILSRVLRDQPEASVRAIAPQENIPPASQRAVPQYLVVGSEDRLIQPAGVEAFANALRAAGHRAEYVLVDGANHAFFDWKPDAGTKATFVRHGVPHAAAMKRFFDGVFQRDAPPRNR